MSTSTFAELGVSSIVVSTLSTAGIKEPFAIQNAVIADAIAGRDVIAQSPTGSGKTLAFGIPLVERLEATDPRPSALVLAPTRELATQIVEEIRPIAHSRALSVTAVYGGVGLVKQAKDAARSHILVATPGRLEDLLERGAFRLDNIRVLVLDEADRMLDMGFRPPINRIVGACPDDRQTLLFSATLDGEAGKIASEYTIDPATHKHGSTNRQANLEIEHRFVPVEHPTRVDALIEQLEQQRDLALVFVRTKHGADRLVKQLAARDIKAVAMHGNKSQRQREQALERFESFKVDTLVATDVAARGIDVDGISHVINFDPPADSETYVHRVGRTGRAGRSGIGITLLSPDQRKEVASLVGVLGIDHGLYPNPTRRPGSEEHSSSERRPSRSSAGRDDRPSRSSAGRDDRPSRSSAGRDDRPSRSSAGRDDRPSRSSAGRDDRPSRSNAGRDDRPSRSNAGRDDRPSRPNAGRDDRPSRPASSRDDRSSRATGGRDNRAKRPTGSGESRPKWSATGGDDRAKRPASGADGRPSVKGSSGDHRSSGPAASGARQHNRSSKRPRTSA